MGYALAGQVSYAQLRAVKIDVDSALGVVVRYFGEWIEVGGVDAKAVGVSHFRSGENGSAMG